MLIWTRLGFLVPLIWIGVAGIAVEMGLHLLLSKPYDAIIVLLCSGIIYWFVGNYFHKDSPSQANQKHESKVINKQPHTFFFIKIEYWAFIAVILSLIFFIQSLFS